VPPKNEKKNTPEMVLLIQSKKNLSKICKHIISNRRNKVDLINYQFSPQGMSHMNNPFYWWISKKRYGI